MLPLLCWHTWYPNDVGILGTQMFHHPVSTTMASSHVCSLDDVIGVLNAHIIYWLFLFCFSFLYQLLCVTALRNLIPAKHKNFFYYYPILIINYLNQNCEKEIYIYIYIYIYTYIYIYCNCNILIIMMFINMSFIGIGLTSLLNSLVCKA